MILSVLLLQLFRCSAGTYGYGGDYGKGYGTYGGGTYGGYGAEYPVDIMDVAMAQGGPMSPEFMMGAVSKSN
jgi:hypothetical protein